MRLLGWHGCTLRFNTPNAEAAGRCKLDLDATVRMHVDLYTLSAGLNRSRVLRTVF